MKNIKINKFYFNLINENFDKKVIYFMIAFERKYVNIYHSIMATINNYMLNGVSDRDIIFDNYIKKWKIERPEIEIYHREVKYIFDYCFDKYIIK